MTSIPQLLRPRYLEPHRAYHGLAHVETLLALLDEHAAWARDRPAIELAIWFHDAVYDPQRSDNEMRSAELAAEMLGRDQADATLVAKVQRMVRATQRHEWTDGDADTALFLDLDLSILGAGEAAYDRYAKQIRQEYAWVPEPDFRAQRAAVLRRFLARERLYFTPALRARWEEAARRNLAREIAALSVGVVGEGG